MGSAVQSFAFTQTATGTVTAPVFTGSAASGLAFTQGASGSVPFLASAAQSLTFAQAAVGTTGAPGDVTGSAVTALVFAQNAAGTFAGVAVLTASLGSSDSHTSLGAEDAVEHLTAHTNHSGHLTGKED